jgi:hypothetical protein
MLTPSSKPCQAASSRWYLVHRKEKRLSATAQAFKEFVLSY